MSGITTISITKLYKDLTSSRGAHLAQNSTTSTSAVSQHRPDDVFPSEWRISDTTFYVISVII